MTTQRHLFQAGQQALPGLEDFTRMETGTMSIFPGKEMYFKISTSMITLLCFRKMPLVPKMISELIYALPPLGDARVLDLLCKW